MRRTHPRTPALRAVSLFARIALFVLLGSAARGATLRVPGEYATIQEAIDLAGDGDRILVAPGTYDEPWSLSEERAVTLSGSGADRTIVSCPEIELEGPVGPGLIVEGLTLRSHVDCRGASPTIRDCILERGVWCAGSALTLENCLLRGTPASLLASLVANGSTPVLRSCTVVASRGEEGSAIVARPGGWDGWADSLVTLTNCIVWGHPDEARAIVGEVVATYSCIQGPEVWPGEGNIREDPRFCGWGDLREVEVTTAEELVAATDGYSFALGPDSPCIGAGESGENLGADLGTCDAGGAAERTITLAPGEYSVGSLDLLHHVSLRGAGQDRTFVEGTISGARTGATLSGLTVVGGEGSGIVVRFGQSPTVEDVTITGGRALRGGGVDIQNASPCFVRCTITGNSAEEVGAAVYAQSSSPVFSRCTIAGNLGPAIYAHDSHVTLASSIVWHNAGGSFSLEGGTEITVTHSAIEGDGPWPGEGNIGDDPEFCGWAGGAGGEAEVEVDPAAPDPGGGLFADVASALASREFDLRLASGSPCRGAGEDGEDMGAGLGVCEGAGRRTLLVRLAAGDHGGVATPGVAFPVSLVGGGRDVTRVEGTVSGLRTGEMLADLTVVGGASGGVHVSAGERPQLLSVRIVGSGGPGVWCDSGAAPLLRSCVIERSEGSGVLAEDGASPELEDCVITGNVADRGGGLYCAGASARLSRCTIVGNAARIEGGGLRYEDARVTVTHSIVWDNIGRSIDGWGSRSVTFSCVEWDGVFPGAGNLEGPPRFGGWGEMDEVSVTTQEELEAALSGYSLALADDSSCLGAGVGGADIGAATGRCEVAGHTERRVLLGPGEFSMAGLDLVHRVSIEGAGEEETVIRGTVRGLRTGASLSRVTVTGGTGSGIVVYSRQAPEIADCMITENRAELGGGVYASRSSPTLRRCTISTNRSETAGHFYGGGGLHLVDARALLVDCRILENLAGSTHDARVGGGGGVFCRGGHVTLERCRLSTNEIEDGSVDGEGAGLHVAEGRVTLRECTVEEHSLARHGGGLYAGEGSWLTLTDCEVRRNGVRSSAGTGGALLGSRAHVRAERSRFVDNWVGSNAGSPRDGTGGALCLWDCDTILTDCRVLGNSAGVGGGFCARFGTLLATRCEIAENLDEGLRLWDVEAALTSCLVRDNDQIRHHGGGLVCDGAVATLVHSTLADYRGPTVRLWGDATVRFEGCILWCRPEAEALEVASGRAEVVGSNVTGRSVWPGEGNTSLDPRFVAPGREREGGGMRRLVPGEDYRLRPASPCIDAGSSEPAVDTDLDGVPRPQGVAADLGAYEFTLSSELTFVRGDPNVDGSVELSDAVAILAWLFRGASAPRCLAAADVDGDARVRLTDSVYLLRHLYLGGSPPVAPFPECGPPRSASDQGLGCDEPSPCP